MACQGRYSVGLPGGCQLLLGLLFVCCIGSNALQLGGSASCTLCCSALPAGKSVKRVLAAARLLGSDVGDTGILAWDSWLSMRRRAAVAGNSRHFDKWGYMLRLVNLLVNDVASGL